MRFLVAVLLTIGFLLTIVGCVNTDSGQQGGGGTGKFLLKMDLSDVMSGGSITTESFKNGSDPEYYFLYLQLIDGGRRDFNYQKIDSPDFTIELDKDAVYLFAIAEKKQDEGIKTIGVITSIDLGNVIFPISLTATSTIDLGAILRKEDALYTTVGTSDLLKAIGYTRSYIESLKGYDVTLKHFLNPDINQDGIFDKDQGLEWYLNPSFELCYEDENYYDENGNVNIDSTSPNVIFRELILWIRWGELKKTDSNASNWNCSLENYNLQSPGKNEPPNSPLNEQWFRFNFGSGSIDRPPNGSYTFKLSHPATSLTLQIDNVNFLITPESELFVIPILNVKASSNGRLKSISWKWKKYENGEYIPVDKEAVKLILAGDNLFSFHTFFETPNPAERKFIVPAELGIKPWNDGSLNDFKEDYWLYSPISYSEFDPVFIKCGFLDIGENELANLTVVDYDEFPHDFESNAATTTELATGTDLFLINLKYNKDNKYRNTGRFAGIVIKTNGEMLFYESLEPIKSKNEDLSHLTPDEQGSIQEKSESEGKLKFNIDGIDYYLTYQVVYNGKSQGYIGYIEGNISTEGYPTEVNRNSDNYVIYSIFKK